LSGLRQLAAADGRITAAVQEALQEAGVAMTEEELLEKVLGALTSTEGVTLLFNMAKLIAWGEPLEVVAGTPDRFIWTEGVIPAPTAVPTTTPGPGPTSTTVPGTPVPTSTP
jgi:hypothetical protein